MSTIKTLATKAKKSRLGWIIALGGAVAAAVGAAVYFGDKKPAAAAPPAAPTTQVPVWTQLSPVANPNLPGTYMVTVPANATFAFADLASDPNLGQIVAGLNAAIQAGTVVTPQTYQAGATPPAGWPADGFGANGYRASGVANTTFSLSLGPLSGTNPTNPPAVWIVSGFTNA
jgi:hypothetical protein